MDARSTKSDWERSFEVWDMASVEMAVEGILETRQQEMDRYLRKVGGKSTEINQFLEF